MLQQISKVIFMPLPMFEVCHKKANLLYPQIAGSVKITPFS